MRGNCYHNSVKLKSNNYKYVYQIKGGRSDKKWYVRISLKDLDFTGYYDSEEAAGRAVDFQMVIHDKKPVNGFKIIKKENNE